VELEHLKIKTRLTNEKFASVMGECVGAMLDLILNKTKCQVYLQQNKKKAEAKGKNCHAKTMWSLEKPILLI
jgi:hypothetical protein